MIKILKRKIGEEMNRENTLPGRSLQGRGAALQPYLLAAGTVTLLFLLLMVLCQLYPFGDKSLASSDAENQYLNFCTYFRNSFFNNNDLQYSFSTVLGGNIQGLLAYYLGSPLYFLFLLFSEEQILLALHLVIYLKLLIAAMTFCAWAGYHRKGNPWMRAALSVCYAYMGYTVTFYSLLSWLDAVVLLPLVVLGLERLVESRKPLVYLLSLGVTIMVNYYVGFMVCLAAVLSYAAILFVHPAGMWKALKRSIVPFTLSSLLAGALSAWVLLPTLLSMPESRVQQMENAVDTMHVNFPFLHFFTKFFTGTTSAEQFFDGLPTVFVGIIPLVLVVLFFLNPGVRRRWKAAAAGLLLVLLFSFHNSTLNIVWHGFTRNRMFNYRYSFVFSFVMLAVAWYSTCQWKALNPGVLLRCFGVLMTGTLLVFTFTYPYGSATTLYFDLTLMVVGLGLMVAALQGRRLAVGALACVMALNSLVNGELSISNIDGQFGSAQYSEVTDFRTQMQAAMELIPEDVEFYRIEKTFYRNYCDNMTMNIPGIGNYSSVEQEEAMGFVWKLGLQRYVAWAHYNGDNPVASENLLGLRYLLTDKPLGSGRTDYTLMGTTEAGISVYHNPHALPVVMASATLLAEPGETDGFRFQNACWQSLRPEIGQPVFCRVLRQNTQAAEEAQTYLLTYVMPEAGNAYLHLPGDYTGQERQFSVEVEDEALQINTYQPTYSLGTYHQGEQIILTVHIWGGDVEKTLENLLVYLERPQALTAYCQAVQSTSVEVEKVTSSHLSVQCQVGADTPYLVSTIPYDESWQVTVDGTPVQTLKNWGAMLAFAVEPGSHTIELRYSVPGKTAGWAITVTAATVVASGAVLVAVREKKRRKTACGLADGEQELPPAGEGE